ncbi:MAG: GWxTD domain-containing protein [Gemmatimonadota bacterium]|nr:GWxTD domain-containing protein [Gemmatimonadota bacterium]
MVPFPDCARKRLWRSALFAAVIIAASCPLEDLDAQVRQTAISAASGGHTAWAIGLETGSSAITEIWVETRGSQPRHLGTFPGPPGRLEWAARGERLRFQEAALKVPLHTLTILPDRSVPLVAPGVWEISVLDGSIARSRIDFKTEPVTPSVVEVGNAPRPTPAAKAVLWGVAAVFNASALAYTTVHRWEFRSAVGRYRKASQAWAALPLRFKKHGLYEEPVLAYAGALAATARKAAAKRGARWVCEDHLTVIGDALYAYEQAHENQRPSDLAALRNWIATHSLTPADSIVVKTLFRSPNDPEKGRQFSYTHGYRPEAEDGEAVVTSFFHDGYLVESVRSVEGYRTIDRRVGKVQIDSLLNLGTELTPHEPLRAISTLEILAGVAQDYARGHSGLGFAYLEAERLERAVKSFERAIECDHTLAEAYFGLGLTFRKWPRGNYDAIRYFQKALQYDRDHVEARFNIADIRYKLDEHDVRREVKKVLAIDPRYAPAYLLMGKWVEEFEKNYEKAALYYAKYMGLRPGDPEGRKRLGAIYLRTKDYGRILEVLEDYAVQNPDDDQVLPILAQACMKLGAYDRAAAFFRDFLERADAAEKGHYHDIRLVAPKETLAAFEQTPLEDRWDFVKKFWADQDPDLTTTANERLLEHYRRVSFAMQNFSEGRQPWDQRGEVYIRFGEPDHRSTSKELNFQQSMAVQRVKERLSRALYGAARPPRQGIGLRGASSTFVGPVYPVRSVRGRGRGGSYRPVTATYDGSMVPWETWTYVDVGSGIEITFTDEFSNGNYNYAPEPLDAGIPARRLALLTRYSPRNIYLMAAAAQPNYFVRPKNSLPMEFYFNSADFRSERDFRTALEVYVGIPRHQGHYMIDDDRTEIMVDRTVALRNPATGAVYRSEDKVQFATKGDVTAERSAFVPDLARMDVPPGRYRMEVKLKDNLSVQHGRYRQDIEIESYERHSLQVSDLELAWRISDRKDEDKFNKGTLWVIPMPTRTYRVGQNVFVYYEIYNLTRDEFGQTNYQVSYTVTKKGGFSPLGIITSLIRWKKGKREELEVTYEMEGEDTMEVEYVELKLENRPAGKYFLNVTVIDMISGEMAQKKASFILAQ